VRILVGLGNPGAEYAGNRHNIGFMAADAIARRWGFPPWRRRFQGAAAEGALGGEKVLLLKPATYMNDSGRAAAEAVRFYKVALGDVVAIHDELDLAPGKLRVKVGGGNAGHNGLRSLTAHLGNDYKRIRLGIGHPGDKSMVYNYVLNDFTKSERRWVDVLVDAVADNVPLLIAGDDPTFQNRVHLAMEAAGFAAPAKPGAGAEG
jgi:PTH1 family peptidyl-tRNA hydrolase